MLSDQERRLEQPLSVRVGVLSVRVRVRLSISLVWASFFSAGPRTEGTKRPRWPHFKAHFGITPHDSPALGRTTERTRTAEFFGLVSSFARVPPSLRSAALETVDELFLFSLFLSLSLSFSPRADEWGGRTGALSLLPSRPAWTTSQPAAREFCGRRGLPQTFSMAK